MSGPSPAAVVRDWQGAGSHTPTFTLQMQVLGAASCYSTPPYLFSVQYARR